MSSTIAVPFIAVLAVLLMMLVESQLSRFNERTLRARGAIEPADDVYATMTWVYPACFIAMGIEGALAGRAPGAHTLLGVALFGVAKAVKFWAIATLGPRWTFRVLVLPGAPLVRGGPYAWVRHPNYVAVIGEFVSVAILVGAPLAGILAVVVFGALLRRRIRVEERALGLSGPEGV
jgi:methyltransferase